jgi:hypothetical protein
MSPGATIIKINEASVRVTGTEIEVLARQHMATFEALNEQCRLLGEVLSKCDPTSDDGREIQGMFLDFIRIMSRLGCCAALTELSERLKLFQVSEPIQSIPPMPMEDAS